MIETNGAEPLRQTFSSAGIWPEESVQLDRVTYLPSLFSEHTTKRPPGITHEEFETLWEEEKEHSLALGENELSKFKWELLKNIIFEGQGKTYRFPGGVIAISPEFLDLELEIPEELLKETGAILRHAQEARWKRAFPEQETFPPILALLCTKEEFGNCKKYRGEEELVIVDHEALCAYSTVIVNGEYLNDENRLEDILFWAIHDYNHATMSRILTNILGKPTFDAYFHLLLAELSASEGFSISKPMYKKYGKHASLINFAHDHFDPKRRYIYHYLKTFFVDEWQSLIPKEVLSAFYTFFFKNNLWAGIHFTAQRSGLRYGNPYLYTESLFKLAKMQKKGVDSAQITTFLENLLNSIYDHCWTDGNKGFSEGVGEMVFPERKCFTDFLPPSLTTQKDPNKNFRVIGVTPVF